MTGGTRRGRSLPRVEVAVLDKAWGDAPALARHCRRAARAALAGSGGNPGTVTVVLTSDAHARALNRRFRGKNRPTNVLAFPADDAGTGRARALGDVVLARQTVRAEARAARLKAADHLSHLVVHGVLHLLGFDHIRAKAADDMEAREIRILARLGVPDPYRARAA